MILLSELSRRRIRSINKLIRVGKNEVVMVIRVDRDKGYIDLSKRRVSAEDVGKAEDRYNKAKAVHSIMRHMSNRLHVPIKSLYERVGWPLYRRYGHAYDALQLAVADPAPILRDLTLADAERAELVEHVKTKMTPQPLKVRADLAVTCFTYEGVEAIRAALLAGTALSTEATPIHIQLIAAPLYVMTTTTLDKLAGVDALTAAIAAVKAVIDAKGGSLVVKKAPAVTTAQDESALARMMADGDGRGEDEDEDEGEEDNEEGMGSGDLGGADDGMFAAPTAASAPAPPGGDAGPAAAGGAGPAAAGAGAPPAPAPVPAAAPPAPPAAGAPEESLAVDLLKKKKVKAKKAAVVEED
jgi:translation initiation factor 2 subunit 1